MAFVLTVLVVGSAGCPIPPQLDVDEGDGGQNSPPIVVSSGPAPEFSFPGPLILDRNDARRLNITLEDNDVSDVLHVRLYVDYLRPAPVNFSSNCTAPTSDSRVRIADCALGNTCSTIDPGDQTEHVLEAMVSDRSFLLESDPLAEGQPPFRAVPDDAAYSLRSWTMICNPPQ